MKKILRSLYYWSLALGVNPFAFKSFLKGFFPFLRDYFELKKQLVGSNSFCFGTALPMLKDRFEYSGVMKGAYFNQDLLVAQRIYENKPLRHIDIGSRIDGFVAHLAVFRPVEVFDIRRQKNSVENIIFKQADLMNLPEAYIGCCESISSLHAIEHFGLGRYSDPIDVDGHLKAIQNIYEMLQCNGKFYFSVPIGPQRIEFNAHRIFSIKYLFDILNDKFIIDYFSYINDEGDLFKHIDLTEELINNNCFCNFGCGIFELTKK